MTKRERLLRNPCVFRKNVCPVGIGACVEMAVKGIVLLTEKQEF